MKKFLLTLALTVVCAFGLTACGNAEAETCPMTIDDAKGCAEEVFFYLDSIYQSGIESEELKNQGTPAEMVAAYDIYLSSINEIGSFNSVDLDSVVVSGNTKKVTVTCDILGADRNAYVELYFENVQSMDGKLTFPDMMISPYYTLAEKMTKAGMNTLMGMGTVFAVLILIMFIISAFSLIPKIEKSIADKKAKKNSSETSTSVDNTIAQIIENEELSDDTELVAVIAAAIAASEGATSTDGVVIRSIRRASTNKWQRA